MTKDNPEPDSVKPRPAAAEDFPVSIVGYSQLHRNPGWFPAMRSKEALEVLRAYSYAFVLAYVIAYRGQYSETFNRYNLSLGEALLGDHENYGMSERQYRTAKGKLEEWGFATFRPTSIGTIAKLTDTRIFAIQPPKADERGDRQATDRRRTGDGQPTTTKNYKNGKSFKNGRVQAAPVWETKEIDPTK